MELQPTLQQIATRYNYKLDEVTPGTVAIPVKDGKFRYQFVYIWIIKEQSGREHIYEQPLWHLYPSSKFVQSIKRISLRQLHHHNSS